MEEGTVLGIDVTPHPPLYMQSLYELASLISYKICMLSEWPVHTKKSYYSIIISFSWSNSYLAG